jgi:hypothetical protein
MDSALAAHAAAVLAYTNASEASRLDAFIDQCVAERLLLRHASTPLLQAVRDRASP